MSVNSFTNRSKSSTPSGKSLRYGKSLVEKIRDLGFEFRSERTSTFVTLQRMDIKLENNRPSDYSIMTPNLNFEQIIYFQPEIIYDEAFPGKNIYKFRDFDSRLKEPKAIRRISDIEVKSHKPTKKMVFKKKKRQSSIISRIEDILNKGKGPVLSRDPSEESVALNPDPEPEKTINDLPENVLQKIFLHFTLQERNFLLSRVCKFWYFILKDPMFWTELEFYNNKVPTETITQLIRKYPSVKKLRLISVPDAVEILQELCRCNHNVTHLAVRQCAVTNQDFTRIILHVISCCISLEILDIKGMRFQSERFYLELGRLKNLKSINLTGNKLLKSQDLITLSVNCRNLRELKILDLSQDNEQGFPLKDDDLTFIILHLQPNLQILKIDMQQLRNVSYQAILKCTNLTYLAMKNCLHLSSEMFRQLPALKNLKKLKITRAINLKPEDFQLVFGSENLNKIDDLDINGCWDVGEIGLQAITHRLNFLKYLSLKNCKSIKGYHLVHLSRCRSLTHLNLAHTDVEFSHLPALYQHVKKLETLVIDTTMNKKPTTQQLRKFFPSIKIILSYSEFQKDERPLDDN